MKIQHAVFFIQTFLIDYSDRLDIYVKEIDDWIIAQHDGIRPDHNVFYDIRNLVFSYLNEERKNIFRMDFKKAEKFLQNYPDKLKEFKEKRKAKS